MKKAEWLIAVLLIGMGITCMTISAVSFQSNPLIQLSVIIKLVTCLVFIGLLSFVFIRIFKARKKH